jgi:hypothetical protein
MSQEQLAFDNNGMLNEAALKAAREWTLLPFHFTTAYFSAGRSRSRVRALAVGEWFDSSFVQGRMWHRAITGPGGVPAGDRRFDFFIVDLGCDPTKQPGPHGDCDSVGD